MRQYSDVKAAPNKAREIIPAGGYVAKVNAAVVETTDYGDRLITVSYTHLTLPTT